MALREELVSSAVSFLQDPSVSSAPLEKKIAFLQSKNLTQEEIDQALSRIGEDSSAAVAQNPTPSTVVQQSSYRQPPPQYGQNYAYGAGGQWQPPPPPPELPKRDWRDWFIMATVMGGVGYGLYSVAKRYITPLIAPPTPPQLQQDKESIDEQFSRAFALLDQLSSDTATLKATEEARTERLDAALREVENVITDLKTSSRRRDEDTRRIGEEVKGLKDSIPKAIDGAKEGNDKRLKELGSELRSLKVLLGNRLSSASSGVSTATTTPRPSSTTPQPSQDAAVNRPNGTTPSSQAAPPAPIPTPAPQHVPTLAPRENSSSPFSQLGKPASIPAWQMAAANKSKNATVSSPSVENAGSSTDDQQTGAPAS
ncbi:peroxin-14 [[Emmonsia] crescens]|uniref:Peroxisomal membrane protein PEX14 n=1 Tax=[Emmonsia] crescens TaxID=73230 RepID=A0A2B7ZC76_9EURO|nr:peroxin-14 [Emmonsia crescens]